MAPPAPWCGCSGPLVIGNALSFALYIVGFLIVIAGLVYGAVMLHVPQHWIVVGGVILLGLGILTGVKATRQKDKAD